MNNDKIFRITLIDRLKNNIQKILTSVNQGGVILTDRSLPHNYKLQTFKNSITYTGVHHFKRSTTTCERHGPIHNAKIWLDSSLQPELFKQ